VGFGGRGRREAKAMSKEITTGMMNTTILYVVIRGFSTRGEVLIDMVMVVGRVCIGRD
jgi:hypothetical protein